MHELPVTQSLLEIALRHAENAGASRILTLNIKIGKLASIVDDSVQFYWDIISKDTIAEGAQLNFHRIAIKIECQNCNQQYSPEEIDFICPFCGSNQIKIIAGQEFSLESIDIE